MLASATFSRLAAYVSVSLLCASLAAPAATPDELLRARASAASTRSSIAAPGKVAWLEISDEERAATASTIQPDADAEVLFRYKQVDASKAGITVTREYMRIKVFNENGVKALSKIEIFYNPNNETIKDMAALITKPDGKEIMLGKKDFFDREAVKTGGDLRMRVASFAFPGLEPGAIVEYQFQRVSGGNTALLRLDLMTDMPTRHLMLRYKNAPLIPSLAAMSYYHLTDGQNRKLAKDGFYFFEMNDVKPFVTEPYMPAADEVRSWMAFFPAESSSPDVFWNALARSFSMWLSIPVSENKGDNLARDKFVRATAEDITRGITSPVAQADAINDYCRGQITNIALYPPPGPPDPKLLATGLRNSDDVIRTKKGRTEQIQFLFVVMARALGLDAHLAFCSRRSDGVFTPKLLWRGYLKDRIVAVRDAGKWHFYDPANCVVDTGLLRFDNEGQHVLVALEDQAMWLTTPVAPPEKSRAKRTADLRLDEDGTLSGNVRIELSGHAASDMRVRYAFETDASIEEKARKSVQARLPNAEVSAVTASGKDDMLKPFVLAYKVRVPNYAEQTGARMFVQPGFFTKGEPPRFTAPTRIYDICFDYPILQEDQVTIQMPDGYSIEEGSSPKSIKRTDWGQYAVVLGHKPKSRVIVYNRTFEYSMLRAPAKEYDTIKKLFDFIQAQDAHLLALKKNN